MPKDERLDELISLYALGVIDEEERTELEELLRRGDGEVKELLEDYEEIVSLLPYSVTPVTPSPRVKEKLFERIGPGEMRTYDETPHVPFWRRIQPALVWLGGAAAAAVVVVLLVSNLSLRRSLNAKQQEIRNLKEQVAEQTETVDSLENVIAERESEIAALEGEVARRAEILEFLENPNVVVVNLVNLKPDLQARGRVLWDTKENEAVFYGLGLPQTPPDKIYQLWVIADGKPKNAGVFSVNRQGNSLVEIEDLSGYGDIQKFAVTLEPEGGVPQPTGEMYLAGES